ncbi:MULTISPECIES: ATP-binding protein [Clostridia]|uniref:ATP-binding protein n=1 Tax=Clostridium sp. 1xD42-85 TaxID=2320084 RepID=UPI0018F3C4C0|nr:MULTISPECIES: ATP-binding protein [Clostridia]
MNNNQMAFVETLIKLTDYEIDMKEINMVKSMVKVAAFLKEVKDFDFSFQLSINKEQILNFTNLRFIERKENGFQPQSKPHWWF